MITKEELIQKLIVGDIDSLKGRPIRMTRVRVPGKEVNLAHVLTPQDKVVYHISKQTLEISFVMCYYNPHK